jgi:VWFA-related protein
MTEGRPSEMMKTALPLLFCLAVPLAAQVRESVTVEVIEVPVYVTSPDGKPVRDLPRDSFELRVNGKKQPIEYFDSVDLATAPAEDRQSPQSAARPARERRLYLLLFDLCFGTRDRIERAQRAAEGMIDRADAANDLFAVATYSPARGVQLATPFVRDRALLRRAIYTLKPVDDSDPLGIVMSAKQHNAWTQTAGVDLARSLGLTGEAADMVIGGYANMDAAQEPTRRLITNQFDGLAALAKRLGALEGQKHVVIFSSGWDWRVMIIPGEGYNEYPDMHARLNEMASAFRAAGAFLHGVDLSGVRQGPNGMIDGQEGLLRTIRPTGGELLRNTNDFGVALKELAASQEVVYILGFQRRANAAGSIDVRVNGLPRVTRVTFRPGFGAPPVKKEIDALQLADVVLNDVPQSGVTLQAGVTTYPDAAEVAVAFNRAEVMPQLTAQPAVDVLLYIFDEHGAAAGYKSRRVTFDEAARVAAGYLTIRETFPLPPGKYAAKVLLHIVGTTSLGFARKDFAVE